MKNNFLSKVIILASGAAGAQAISLIVMPLVTRIYTPVAIGELSLFTTIIALFFIFVSLGLTPAIIVVDDLQEAKNICSFIFFVSCFLMVLLMLLILIAGFFIESDIFTFIVNNFLIITFATITLVLFNIYKQYAIRNQKFKKISKSILVQSLANNFLKLGLGLLFPFSKTLLLSYIASYIVNCLLIREKVIGFLRYKDFGYIFYKNIDYPKFRMPQMFINSLSEALPIIYLTQFYGLKAVGIYSLSRLTLGAPIMILGQSISDIFISRFARVRNKKEYLKVTLFLVFLGCLISIFINLFGERVYGFVFGDNWALSGTYAAWISFWMLSYLSSRPAVSVVAVLNFQRGFLIFEIFSVTLKIISLYLGYFFFKDALMSIIFFSLISMILYLFLSFLIYRKI